MMRRNSWMVLAASLLLVLVVSVGWSRFQDAPAGMSMVDAAKAYLATLDEKHQAQTTMPYDSEKRVDWHFIPKMERKGLQFRDMKPEQRKAAGQLLRSSLSQAGYTKAQKIMALEAVLHDLEKANPGKFRRDTERYYYTLFGEVGAESRWGLSIEGHHLSLNFVVDKGKVISSTPTVLCANPLIVPADFPGLKKGERVLAKEESLAFDLINSLSEEELKIAMIADKAPREVRAAGEAQPPQTESVGLTYGALKTEQKKFLKGLVFEYMRVMPPPVMAERNKAIIAANPDNIHFAWAGSRKPGVGHYYRIQGPTFLVEFVNTQPDAAGNPASHIHSIWRDLSGDFAIPVAKK
ncbi:MAG: DUF3500 domain-containing protein [Pirellulaceae bacterium]